MTGVTNSTGVEPTGVDLAAQRYAALADVTRLRVLGVLAVGTRCVCDLQEAVGVAPNLLSYHLRVLREAGLIRSTRRGRWIDYRIAANSTAFVADALATARLVPAAVGCGPSCARDIEDTVQ